MMRIKTAFVPLFLLLLFQSPAILEGQAPTAPEVVVIQAGRLFDSEKGILLPAATIVVKSPVRLS